MLKSAYLANLPPNRVVPTFPLEFINYVIYKYSLVLTTNKPSHLCLMLFPMSVAKGRPLVPFFLATRIMDKVEELLLEPPRYTTSKYTWICTRETMFSRRVAHLVDVPLSINTLLVPRRSVGENLTRLV